VAGVSVLAAACVALLVLHTPLLAVRHATVQGATHTGAAAVLDAAGLADSPPLIDVNPKTAAAQVERLPWVKRAVVVRRWPDSVVVRVTERVPVGAFALAGGQVALVDATGRVLAWEPGPATGPTLGGPVAPGRPGTDIAAADHPALEVAALLPASIAGDVATVSVDHSGALTLTLAGRVTAVLGDDVELPAKLVSLASVLEDTHVTRGTQIDVTVPGEPVVGPQPAPSRSGAEGR
jgi:cell division protein FtsQ